jgi:hypothetical protein
MDERQKRGEIFGYGGAVFGVCGWVFGMVVVCLISGAYDVLGRVLLIGLPVSLGIGLTIVVGHAAIGRACGRTSGEAILGLWGLIATAMGVLVLLLTHWLAPMILAHEKLREMMPPGTIYKVGDWLPAVLLAAGSIMLLVVLRRVLRAEPREGSQETTATSACASPRAGDNVTSQLAEQ